MCPNGCHHAHSTHCGCGDTLMVSPYELSVASGGESAQALVGGSAPVYLSMEYLVDTGAKAPSITLTATSDAATSTWQETSPGSGYQVKAHFMSIQPGTTLKVDATEATARVRWCESFCC